MSIAAREQDRQPRRFQHIRTGNLYWFLSHAKHKSGMEDKYCVVYCHCDDENTIYVRDLDDWHKNFEELRD